MRKVILIISFILFHIFILSQLYYWLRGITRWKYLLVFLAAAETAAAFLPLAGAFWLWGRELKDTFLRTGNRILGIDIYLALGFIILLIVRLMAAMLRHPFGKIPCRPAAWIAFLACISFTAIMNGYGHRNAITNRVTSYTVQFTRDGSGAQPSAREMKIVLLSDMHLGVNTDLNQMEDMVRQVNEQAADVIFIAGDFFSSTFEGVKEEELEKIFSQMKAENGVYYVWGNHDVEEPLLFGFPLQKASLARRPAKMDDFVRACGFRDINDKTLVIDNVQFAGRKDMDKTGDGKNKRKSAAQLLGGLRTDMPTVVIEHEPYDLDELQKNGADLVLSGHTHGGQLWPGNILVRFMYKNAAGQKKVGGMETITTAGIGTYGPPLRLGCAAEIPVISLYY